MCFLAVPVVQAARVFADDYAYQKQLVMDAARMKTGQEFLTCQAFRIHENWFATAAHCVEACVFEAKCDIQILLAQGAINVATRVDRRDIFIPKGYRTVDEKKGVTKHKSWDVALIHYRPEGYIYEFAEGGSATAEEFNEALKQFSDLRVQWKGAIRPKIPVLYTYGGENVMELEQNLIVPRWTFGQLVVLSNPQTVLYFGEKQSLWGSDGFGVEGGNSGGAVVLEDGGIVGIATYISSAGANNLLPADVRRKFPAFGQAYEFFVFNGFDPQTTLKFIEKNMLKFGDHPRTKKLRHLKLVAEP